MTGLLGMTARTALHPGDFIETPAKGFAMVTAVDYVRRTFKAETWQYSRAFDQTADGGFAGVFQAAPVPEGWAEVES